MFLLLAVGFLGAATALISEWMGGFTRRCRFLCRQKKERQQTASREELISTTGSDEIKAISGDLESRIHFDTRSPSAGSRDTLEGQVINVTEENILVHERLDVGDWDSRRSSSVALDREVTEIFEKERTRRVVEEDVVVTDEDRNTSVSKNTFGDYLMCDKEDKP